MSSQVDIFGELHEPLEPLEPLEEGWRRTPKGFEVRFSGGLVGYFPTADSAKRAYRRAFDRAFPQPRLFEPQMEGQLDLLTATTDEGSDND